MISLDRGEQRLKARIDARAQARSYLGASKHGKGHEHTETEYLAPQPKTARRIQPIPISELEGQEGLKATAIAGLGLFAIIGVAGQADAATPQVSLVETEKDNWKLPTSGFFSDRPGAFQTIDLNWGDPVTRAKKLTSFNLYKGSFEKFDMEGFWKPNTSGTVDVTKAIGQIIPFGVRNAQIIVREGQPTIGFVSHDQISTGPNKEVIHTPTTTLLIPVEGSEFIMFDLSSRAISTHTKSISTNSDGNTIYTVDLPQLKFSPDNSNLVQVTVDGKLRVLDGVQLTVNESGRVDTISWGGNNDLNVKDAPPTPVSNIEFSLGARDLGVTQAVEAIELPVDDPKKVPAILTIEPQAYKLLEIEGQTVKIDQDRLRQVCVYVAAARAKGLGWPELVKMTKAQEEAMVKDYEAKIKAGTSSVMMIDQRGYAQYWPKDKIASIPADPRYGCKFVFAGSPKNLNRIITTFGVSFEEKGYQGVLIKVWDSEPDIYKDRSAKRFLTLVLTEGVLSALSNNIRDYMEITKGLNGPIGAGWKLDGNGGGRFLPDSRDTWKGLPEMLRDLLIGSDYNSPLISK